MNLKLLSGILAVPALVFLVGALAVGCSHKGDHGTEHSISTEAAVVYICPMHPTYTSDKPGECPICGMNLVPVEEDAPDHSKHEMKMKEPKDHAAIKITDTQRQTIGVKTGTVELKNLIRKIKTVGIVAYDPDLAVAQREYIDAVRLGDRSLSQAAESRLELMGMSREQISELKRKRRIQKNLYLPSPDGKVWIYGNIYESDIPYVKTGQVIVVTVPNAPGPRLPGIISAIDPIVDQKTRSLKVRAEVEDPAGRLKPNMYVDLFIDVDIGESIAVPISALMWSDGENYVFIDEGKGKLVPRKIRVGFKTRDYAQALEGIHPGERVVTSANFLIDAESQLKAALREFGGKKDAGEHQHVY